ncbi:2-hydroxyisocaproyl-CoA dehydratase activator [Fundidesulfovibrio magnetotacticus]|uniref:2-hydroxyisocaproyl-CoA dehydratase activator n=1 Tax=Fundidesulfovibrio magnetotacticus TaxID=2730080 RepID=A0A6V8M130_9BACT|nr:BadF/BadG/BcrA/BcrD ATPase family protein [Fundidesulfovibrio magnetotacticus]GFK95939.1 2-hydroxyisocaproyl-CoA dehydratase activator [Fundidesulfovibrio magnetotacticus]
MPLNPPDSLGICLGATSVSAVRLRTGRAAQGPIFTASVPHGGDPAGTLRRLIEELPDWCGLHVAVTGRSLRTLTRLPSLSEPEAVELAASRVRGGDDGPCTVLSAGGETFMAYALDASGRVRDIQSGNKCASGTGEFLAQQLARMGLAVEDLPGLDPQAQPWAVSGRCSVFCKSDCTHALNKGADKSSVVAGLGRMMALRCLELLEGLPPAPVLLTGGCAANPFLVRFLRQELPALTVPPEAPWFEALGAALWAENRRPAPPGHGDPVTGRARSFARRKPLRETLGLVDFKHAPRVEARPGDVAVAGLDVGSTTTKGVVVRLRDGAVLAGEYLRTGGDPVGASRRVYAALARTLEGRARIQGLGVTGSGRAIAALHAGATAAINEIVAHAAAAVHYDPDVDTIFEIGGQDAKYTQLDKGRPCDAAMNEACSAGTGSFLEEAAWESLRVPTADIAPMALAADATPDFNDQCSAFIGSDIKRAAQEGMPLPEILAGLAHSVCLNYVTRVKGNRPVGRRIFMQGGVCYNRAVPAAMAMLTGRRIVVPPEPGLMGALGVALEVARRQDEGLLPRGDFDLDALAGREASRRAPFICRGGRGGQQGCDRGCRIERIEVAGRVHPFGGICNRFENLRQGRSADARELDFVQARQRRVFRDHQAPLPGRPTVGISRSYLTNTYYPLFAAFFRELGHEPLLARRAEPEGIKRRLAALCHPAELAHGFLADLLTQRPDHLFLPHVRSVPEAGGQADSCTCVLLQGEPFYLRGAFPELEAYAGRLHTPTLDFRQGLPHCERPFTELARALGADARAARRAFRAGVEAQAACRADLDALGREAMARLDAHTGLTGVVLFGRAYNAFAAEANKAVPEKLATRGALVIPCDMLPMDPHARDDFTMYWGQGRTILAAARAARAHPRLFGAFVTNFSCGPDSFLLGYFRDEMGPRPSLVLEVDSHTADAGIETRLEAFLDIARSHQRAPRASRPRAAAACVPARVEPRGREPGVRASSGEWLPLRHPRVTLALPSMNPVASTLSAHALRGQGIRALALPPADDEALKLGRGNSSCKECLPLQLTVGTLLEHLETRPANEVTLYFMPGAQGPCRFGQYERFTRKLIARNAIPDAAVLSATADNGYQGLGAAVTLAIWRGVAAGDFLEEARSMLLAAACDPADALAAWDIARERIGEAMARSWREALDTMRREALALARLPLRAPVRDVPVVLLAGEIFVRHDPISRQGLLERLAADGIAVRTAPVSEWVFYTDWLQNRGITRPSGIAGRVRQWFKRLAWRQARAALAPSGLTGLHASPVEALVRAAAPYVSPLLTGEAVLTVGGAFQEILAPYCGVLAMGPFGCMPARLAEAALVRRFDTDALARLHPGRVRRLPAHARGKLPLLCLETDGNPFPQLAEARLEAFCLQALRLHEAMAASPSDRP